MIAVALVLAFGSAAALNWSYLVQHGEAAAMPPLTVRRPLRSLRHLFSKNNGNLGETGSVGYLFSKKGLIVVPKSAVSEEKLTEIALEAGADDLADDGDSWEVTTDPKQFEAVLEAIKAAKIEPDVAEVTMVPSTYQKLEGTQAAAMNRLLEALEDLDDTQNVYSNYDMGEAAVAAS